MSELPPSQSASGKAGPSTGSSDEASAVEAGFGTFAGVFTPSILTILGVIMYLRFGWVVGNVGLWQTLIIVTICTSITALTALSMASIATDRRVKAGGAYYMISRSLGVETGGAVGIPVYFALAFSVALYTIGFAESVTRVFPLVPQTALAAVTTVIVAILAIVSARLVIRAQYFIMAGIGISLLSLLFGGPLEATSLQLQPAPNAEAGFWVVLAVFFPAVTGIEAGVNMSGDLKDPARSIPRGTLAALGVGYLVYMTLPVLLSTRADAQSLIDDPLIMRRIAFWGDAILLGVWGATLSSALGSILGAPRVLQALARDGVLPRWMRVLGRGSGPGDEPRVGTVVTLAVALSAVMLGELNVIAPILTMFFLASYLSVNLGAGLENMLGSPSFRPSFRVHWSVSLLGALGCLVVMLLINAVATVAAAVVIGGVFLWLERQELRTTWGDVRRGVMLSVARGALLRLQGEPPDAKNWRPNLLVLSGAPTGRWHLVEFADALTHGRALMTVATVLRSGAIDPAARRSMQEHVREYLERKGLQALVRIEEAPTPFEGMERLIATYGFGPLVPNTVLLGASEDPSHRAEYCRSLAMMHELRRNVVVLRHDTERGFGAQKRIDVWWGGMQSNGGLMMLMGYLLRTSIPWRRATLTIKLMVPDQRAAEAARANLQTMIQGLRIGAEAKVLIGEQSSFPEVLRRSSAHADLVLMGLAMPGSVDDYEGYYQHLQEMTAGLPTTAFVLASEDLDFAEVLL
ncbi:MAG: amino acid permease [Gemmatimonadetes bacterium]|nr:amino acid permease [Gemmatimonadota bacterium]